MVFSSLLFLFRFLPIVLALYYLSPVKFRNAVLFFCSLIFYAWGEPIYLLLMLFSTVADYCHGLLVENFLKKGWKRKARLTVISSILINLGLLFFFKYSGFFMESFCQITGLSLPIPQVSLPIGISFYTFQTMSYPIDIYRGKAKAQKNLLSFGAYVCLFPQLIAGPIVRYQTIAKELVFRRESTSDFAQGIRRFFIGLGKKVLLANSIGVLWDTVSSMNQLPQATAWLGILAFAFQIYFDFSGYSDMAIGMGKMFGFHFLENFNYPYISRSITEFWRRWHISLGEWFREYVYIPLGGNRKGILIQLRNILLVWILTGLWHGASWNFLAWGLWFAILLLAEKLFLLKWLQALPGFFGHLYTLLALCVGWVIFAFDSFSQGLFYLRALFLPSGIWDPQSLYLMANYGILLILCLIGCTKLPSRICKKWLSRLPGEILPAIVENLFYAALFFLCLAGLVDATYNPFLYFRF